MKKRNQLLALCALVILVLTVFACENPFIPGKYKEPSPPQAPSVSVEASPIGPYVKGEGVTITAKASVGDGGELSYQWYSNTKNSSSGGKAVSGATGESYRPSTDMSSDNILEPTISYYYVQVTNTLNGRSTSASSRAVDVAVFDIPIGTTPIREIGLTVTPPVKDGVPAVLEGVTSTGSGYSIQAVSWSPPHNAFMSGGKYTIWVTLTADAGYTFIALRTATINGQAAAVESNNGNTLYLSYEFKQVDVRVVTGIAIKTQPTKLSYTHGEMLDLAGLAVTLTYDSGDPEDVPFVNFAARTITTNLQNNITLSHTGHNNTNIIVSCNNYSTNTNNLTVNKAEITHAFVGIDPPAKGDIANLTASVDVTAGYTSSAVSWSPAPDANNKFVGNETYTATVTLTAKADFEFATGTLTAHVNNNAATVTDKTAASVKLSFEFPLTYAGTVSGILIKNQPTKLSYTHGETLDLSGLVVTIDFENDVDIDITFPSAVFQTNPAHGSTVIAALNNTQIQINYSGHNATTNPLTVSQKALTLDLTSAVSHTKVYDGNTSASNIGVSGVRLVGVIGTDQVYVITVTGAYANANVETTKYIDITAVILAGSQGTNYTVDLTPPKNRIPVTGGITPATPTVTTWPTASAIDFGQELSVSTLTPASGSGTGLNNESVPGTFAWTTPSTVPNGGISSHSVTFTSTNANYGTTTGNVDITVNPQVTFNMNNGNISGSTDDVIRIATYGGLVSKPANPTRTSYTFNGWYTSNTATAPFNLGNVTSNVTLYARWILTSTINAVTNTNNFMNMVWVGGGNFKMGQSGNGNNSTFPNMTPVHDVILSGFYIGRYQVTREQYYSVMGGTAPGSSGSYPQMSISWVEAAEFCNKLSDREGLQKVYVVDASRTTADWTKNGYRLPTEAEWEFAAKGGQSASNPPKIFAGSDTSSVVGWTANSGSNAVHSVGEKSPNELGTYDMTGNVWEWVWDWYAPYTSDAQVDPKGGAANNSQQKVIRGGSSTYAERSIVFRDYRTYSSKNDFTPNVGIWGFRVARNAN